MSLINMKAKANDFFFLVFMRRVFLSGKSIFLVTSTKLALTFVTYLVCYFLLILGDPPDVASPLLFSFTMLRHGDRTPSIHNMRYSTDPEELETLVEPYGYKKLTERGMYRAYLAGVSMRAMFKDLIGPKYNESEIYLRSTDGSRSKESLLTALAALYPPVKRWHKEIDWTPVPYTTEPETYDFNAATKNCPVFMKVYKEMFRTFYPEMERHKAVMDLVSEATEVGFNITERPLHMINSFDILASQVSLGLPVGPALKKKWRDIEKAALTAYNLMYQQKKYRSFVAGVLLNEFFKYSKRAILDKETERVRIYTAHKENVFAFSKIAKTTIDGFPNFASSFALNLRREIDIDNGTERIFVEPVLSLPKLKGFVKSRVFPIEGCGTRCYYDEFVDLTKKHAWGYAEWRTYCHDLQETDDKAGPVPIDNE